jgi:glucosamine kinase
VPILIGVDAGGTSIACAIERDGKIVPSMGEPANLRTAGVERAADAIAKAIRGGLRDGSFAALVVGAAGAGEPAIARALEVALRERFARGAISVVEDVEIALRAGAGDGDGAVLIAGTGSIAYARVGSEAFRVGGHGHLLGDDGSGFAIGRAALAQMLRWYDGRTPHSELFDAIAVRLQVTSAQQLIDRIYREAQPVASVAAIAPLVLERASSGERTATKIVQGAAVELVDLVKALVKHAKIEGEIPLVFTGGLLAENSLLSYLIETRLLADLPLVHPVKSAPAPVHGALAMARRLV